MPVYVLFCPKCKLHTEKNVPIHKRNRQRCEDCGEPLKVVPQASAVHFHPTRGRK